MNIFSITMTSISPPYDDGPKNMVLGLARELKNHNFFFISFLRKKFSSENNITFIASPFQNGPALRMSFMQQLFIFIAMLFNLRRVDTFQFFFTPRKYFSIVFAHLVKRFRKKSIQIISSVHSLYDSRGCEEKVKDLLFADRIVVQSDYAKKKLSDEGAENVIRIYPGIDTDRFTNKSPRQPFFGEDEGKSPFRVIYPCSYRVLESSYSFTDFCGIVLHASRKVDNIKFIMACKVREKNDLILKREFQKTAKETGLIGFFIFLDIVEDMPSLINSCDIGIFPAHNKLKGILELPLVMLEMSALAKTVIYSEIPPLDELKAHNMGMSLRDTSAEAYADAIVRLFHDKEYCNKMGELSRDAVYGNFTLKKMSLEYNALYNSLK